MSQNIPFLCECFPHLERRVIEKIVRENSYKSTDQICSILIGVPDVVGRYKRKNSPSIEESRDLEPVTKKRKAIEEDEDDDEVKILKTILPPKKTSQRKKRRRKKKKSPPTYNDNRPGRSERSKFLAKLHGSRMMSVDPPLFVGDGEDRRFKAQKEKFRMKKIHFESELNSVRRKQAQKWKNQGGTPTNANPSSSETFNKRRMMTLNSIPSAYDSTPTYPNLNNGSVNSIAGLNQREADPKRVGVDSLRFTNEYRRKQGLKDLKWNESLYNIAMVHSKRMGDKKCPFGHHGFNTRMNEMTRKCNAVSGAENVAWTSSENQIAKETVDGWIGSPGHRKNMVSNQKFCAIAVYKNSQGRFYLTQLFCR